MDVLALLERHTRLLVTTATSVNDLDQDTWCPGWTRSHVLNHVARNAQAVARGVRGILDGTGETMYASAQARDDDIAAGLVRDRPTIIHDLEVTAVEVGAAVARVDPLDDRLVSRTPSGQTFPVGYLPFLRLREVVYHHIDLKAGFTFDDVEVGLVTAFLHKEVDDASVERRRDLLWQLARGGEL